MLSSKTENSIDVKTKQRKEEPIHFAGNIQNYLQIRNSTYKLINQFMYKQAIMDRNTNLEKIIILTLLMLTS